MNLLFDLDGTLTDPKEGIVRSIRFAMDALGRPLGETLDLDWCIGPPLLNSLRKILGKEHEDEAEKVLELYRERFKEKGIFENRLYPRIKEILELLSNKHSLFVATSKPMVFAAEIANHFGLAEYFDGIYGSDLNGANSDKSDLISKIILENRLDIENTIMIGDREHDMTGAKHNKIKAAGILWGYGSRDELESSGADVLLESPERLLEYFVPRNRK